MKQPYSIQWLKEHWGNDNSLKFIYFWGHTPSGNDIIGKSCLSQWYESDFTVDGITYITSEHWMMAQKALLFDDQAVYQQIIRSRKPGEAKDLGRQVKDFNDEIWKENRISIVRQGNLQKFGQNQALSDYLLATGNRILVEASPIDPIWGIGLSEDDKRIGQIDAWRGQNLLGFVLMEVRDLLRTG